MEPLNPAHAHRALSPGRPSPTPTPVLPGYRGFDNESSYTPRSPTVPSPAPMSTYGHQPYADHAFANPYQSRTGTPAAYTPQPQHYHPSAPLPAASSVDMPRYSPYGQQSPAVMPFRQPSPGVMPVRQPSPGIMPVRQPSPGIVPYRQASPGSINPPPSYATHPPYRGMSPSIPTSSPPPPFMSPPASEPNEPGRPPSLLQSGRKPATNF